MKNIIKTFLLSIVALGGIFAGASVASAAASATSCTSASLEAKVTTQGYATTIWFELGTNQSAVSSGSGFRTASQVVPASMPEANVAQNVTNLSANTTYYYRAMITSTGWAPKSTEVRSFTTPSCGGTTPPPGVSQPSVSTLGSSNIGTRSATLNGSVNGNGSNASAWFEWGTTSGYGNTTPSYGYGSGSLNYNGYLNNLNPNTTYYFRAVAQGSTGSPVYGEQRSFTTTSDYQPPQNSTVSVSTSGSTGVSQNSATINGTVNGNGSNASAWFEWGPTTSLGYTTTSGSYGTGYATYNAYLPNLAPNTVYYYQAVANNGYGGAQRGSLMSFTTTSNYQPPYNPPYNPPVNNCSQPSITTSGANNITSSSANLNAYVNGNNCYTTAWFEWGTSYYGLNGSTGQNSVGSTYTSTVGYLSNLSPNTTYYFRAVAQNSYGTVYGDRLSFTTNSSGTYVPPTYVPPTTGNTSAPTAVTTLATQITTTSAQLNSLIFTNASVGSTAWFEWGTTAGLGYKTASASVGNLPSVRHADTISGLTDGVTYYYRIVAENQYGRSNGLIYTFVAGGTTPVRDNTVVINRPVTTPVTTVVNYGTGIESLVKLTVNGGADIITAGERRTYDITWRNDSKLSLNKVALRVILPDSLTFVSGSRGSFSSADNTLTVDIKTLAPGETGNVVVVVDAKRTIKNGDLVVTVANLVYTTPAGIQGAADAYATHTGAVSGNNLGASIFGAGSFLPTTLLGWLILILLLLILVFLGSHLYGRFSTPAGAPKHH